MFSLALLHTQYNPAKTNHANHSANSFFIQHQKQPTRRIAQLDDCVPFHPQQNRKNLWQRTGSLFNSVEFTMMCTQRNHKLNVCKIYDHKLLLAQPPLAPRNKFVFLELSRESWGRSQQQQFSSFFALCK